MTTPMTDQQMDDLLRQLDVVATPSPVFVAASLGRLAPAVRSARRGDGRWFGGPWPMPTVRLLAIVAVLGLLAIVGAVVVGGRLIRLAFIDDASYIRQYAGAAERISFGDSLFSGASLGDGRVLLSDARPPGGLSLWDMRDGTHAPVGSIAVERERTSMTILADGRVLLLGGDLSAPQADGSRYVVASTAELLDLAVGRSIALGPLAAPRWAFASERMADGRVLIAGGWLPVEPGRSDGDVALSSAEIFDPATGKFSLTSPMSVGRVAPRMVSLADGRILVAGGHANGAARPDIFDPLTGSFSPVDWSMGGDLQVADMAALPDGRILFLFGGCESAIGTGQTPSQTEIYDPANDAWQVGPVVPNCVDRAALLPNGQVLLVGAWWSTEEDPLAPAIVQRGPPGDRGFRPGAVPSEHLRGWTGLLDLTTGIVRTTDPTGLLAPELITLPDGRVILLNAGTGAGDAEIYR